MANRVADQTCGQQGRLIDTLDALVRHGTLNEDVAFHAHRIRKLGNRATHPNQPPVYSIDAMKSVASLFVVAVWFAEGEPGSTLRVEQPFRKEIVGQEPKTEQQIKLVKEVLASDIADLYRGKRLTWKQVVESAVDPRLADASQGAALALVMVELTEWHANLMNQHGVRPHVQ